MPFFRQALHFMTFLLGHVKKWPASSGFSIFNFFLCLSFFSFSYLFAAVIDLLCTGLASSSMKCWESIIEMRKFYHGVATCSRRQLCSRFFTQISEHFCGYFTPIWISLVRSFPPAEFEHRWCQFCSKVMKSKVKQRSMLATAGCGRHRSWGLKRNWNPNLVEFLVFLSLHWIEIPNILQRDSSLEKFGHKHKFLGHFDDFWSWIGPNWLRSTQKAFVCFPFHWHHELRSQWLISCHYRPTCIQYNSRIFNDIHVLLIKHAKQISEFLDKECPIHLLDVMALNSQILFEAVSRWSSGMDTLKK